MRVSRLLRKTLLGVAVLFFLLSTATGVFSAWNLYTSLIREYRSKGAAIARSIADSSVEILVHEDAASVQATVDQFLDIEGVSYVFVVDPRGEFICHTFVPKAPDELRELAVAGATNSEASGGAEEVVITRVGDLMDVSAPILGGLVGYVHVGMDRNAIIRQITDGIVRQSLIVLALFILSILLTYKLVQRVSKPLLDLTEYAGQLANREWSRTVDIHSDDEIGVLAKTMQSMAGDLAGVFERLEDDVRKATEELRGKNERLEKALERVNVMKSQLAEQEKLASLGTLTAGIAHEVKNPLNFVKNFSELSVDLIRELEEELDEAKENLTAEQVESIELVLKDLSDNLLRINRHGRRADDIVQSMLLHSHGQAGKREPADVNELLREYVALAFHSARALHPGFNFEIKEDYDSGLGPAELVVQDIARASLNILLNACYALHKKAGEAENDYEPVLSVQTKAVKYAPPDEPASLVDAVEIRIRDNGSGIPPEVRQKMFDPFFTTKPPGEGTGLGLSLTHDTVVVEHHGRIEVETEAGVFTEFILTLPMKSA
jgi:signal transduction histidine kinase